MEKIRFNPIGDERGWLIAIEEFNQVPFSIRRIYYRYGAKAGVRHGKHAHRFLRHLAICLRGSCRFQLNDGKSTINIVLDRLDRGLLIEPLVWYEIYDYSCDCVLLVLASGGLDEGDCVSDYEEFQRLAQSQVGEGFLSKVRSANTIVASQASDMVNFSPNGDELGWFVTIESLHDVSFEIHRIYYIYRTKSDFRRGKHAHRNLQQLAICVSGSCRFMLDDGSKRREYLLNSNMVGLNIGPMVWREMYDFSADCVLLVLADRVYEPSDYIFDYNEFRAMIEI